MATTVSPRVTCVARTVGTVFNKMDVFVRWQRNAIHDLWRAMGHIANMSRVLHAAREWMPSAWQANDDRTHDDHTAAYHAGGNSAGEHCAEGSHASDEHTGHNRMDENHTDGNDAVTLTHLDSLRSAHTHTQSGGGCSSSGLQRYS